MTAIVRQVFEPDAAGRSVPRIEAMTCSGKPDPSHEDEGTSAPAQKSARDRKVSDPAGQGAELDQAITVLRARVDEEFKIAERLDSKARQAFALAAGFFAVIQTVTFGSFAQDEVSTPERVLLLLVAILAGGFLAKVAHKVTSAEELHVESDLRPGAIVEWANAAGPANEYVRVRLIRGLSEVAQERHDNNEKRATRYEEVVDACRWVLIFSGVELVIAIATRI